MRAMIAGIAAVLALAACSDGEKAGAPTPPAAAAAPAPPPLPELPMTAAKAVKMLEGTSLACQSVASLRFEMNRCEQKIGQGPDDAGFRQEMADFRAGLNGLSTPEIQQRCSARYDELQRTPMPKACWGDRYQ